MTRQMLAILATLAFAPAALAQNRIGYVSSPTALLSCPAPTCTVVQPLSQNESFTIMGESDGYHQVQLADGTSGWLATTTTAFDNPSAPPAAPAGQEAQAADTASGEHMATDQASQSSSTKEGKGQKGLSKKNGKTSSSKSTESGTKSSSKSSSK